MLKNFIKYNLKDCRKEFPDGRGVPDERRYHHRQSKQNEEDAQYILYK